MSRSDTLGKSCGCGQAPGARGIHWRLSATKSRCKQERMDSQGMRKRGGALKVTILLIAVQAMLFTYTGPALAQAAQDDGAAIAQPAGGFPVPTPPDFVLREDGTVIVDGDTGSSCNTFALGLQQGYYQLGDQEQAQSVLEQCEERGFLGSTSGAEPIPAASTSTEASVTVEPAVTSPAVDTLPDTAGVPIFPLAVGVGLLLVGARVLVAARRLGTR